MTDSSNPNPTLIQALKDGTARVGVLCGGLSSERDISFKSGKAVATALKSKGYNVVTIDVGRDLPKRLREEQVDVAWIALHGSFGEDGCTQGMLEIMGIPYTGSGPARSAAAMDKITTKRLLEGSAVMLPGDCTWNPNEARPSDLALPVVAKHPQGGSTIGVYLCHTQDELDAALTECANDVEEVLIEQLISGDEITVAVLDGKALPVVLIRPDTGFFDFEAKYTKGRTEYLVPAPISENAKNSAQTQAVIAYRKLGLSGVARADFIVDDKNIPWFLEINTIPGMTATSLTPMAANATGISFENLVEHLLLDAKLHLSPANQ